MSQEEKKNKKITQGDGALIPRAKEKIQKRTMGRCVCEIERKTASLTGV